MYGKTYAKVITWKWNHSFITWKLIIFVRHKKHRIRAGRKRIFWHVCPTMTQISLRIRAVWLESSLSAWRHFASLTIQNATSEDSDQTARMRRLIWIFAGRTCPEVRFLMSRLIACKSMYCMLAHHDVILVMNQRYFSINANDLSIQQRTMLQTTILTGDTIKS